LRGVTPLIVSGWGRRGLGFAFAVAVAPLLVLWGRVGGWPEVRDEERLERAVLVPDTPAAVLLEGPVEGGSLRGVAWGSEGLSPPTSSSGKVMKKRQPNVVPKKAPSTVWNRELGGV
jgi:hypothetical protein